MSHTDTIEPSIWLNLAIIGDSVTETVTCSIQGGDTDRAAFTVSDSWAAQIAQATTDFLKVIVSIYQNYALFQGLSDDNIQEGIVGLSGTTEPDFRFDGEGPGV